MASNHASFLDPILLGAACPRLLNFAARETLFKNYLFSALLRRVGAFPIKRWSADLSAVKESLRRLKNNGGLVVFPEGSRSPDGKLQNITHGFILLAKNARVPIIPAWISGSYNAWGKAHKCIRPAKIKVVFGRPVYVPKKQSYTDIAQEVFTQFKAP